MHTVFDEDKVVITRAIDMQTLTPYIILLIDNTLLALRDMSIRTRDTFGLNRIRALIT